MARNALGNAAENLVRQRAALSSDLVRTDANPGALPDNHRDISGGDTIHIGDIHADLIHAHDPDDRAPMAADPEVSAAGQRAGEPLPFPERRGGVPAIGGRPPGASVADALALGDRSHLRDTTEDV